MKIAIYGKNFNKNFYKNILNLFDLLEKNHVEVYIFEPFFKFIKQKVKFNPHPSGIYNEHNEIPEDVKFMISIGGDGTFLETVTLIREKHIPIAGINSGRLGFLANIYQDEIEQAIHSMLNDEFTIDARTLIKTETSNDLFGEFNYALNEFTVHKKDTASMISIHAYIDGEYLNSYWADGLIIATPTGSTAYSLSVGGPIVTPESTNFIITPIAPHNLTVGPLVISDNKEISLKVEGRSSNFLASLDHRSRSFNSSVKIKVRKAEFNIHMVKLKNHTFFNTLRNKLMWGFDKRN